MALSGCARRGDAFQDGQGPGSFQGVDPDEPRLACPRRPCGPGEHERGLQDLIKEINIMDMRRGIALVSMLIFVIVFTILSGVVLGVLSNSTRDLESHVRGSKSYFS